MDRPAIVEMILQVLAEIGPKKEGTEYSEQTQLLGPSQVLDSVALVTLITEVEERINERWQSTIVLTNERAMSLEWSPFRTVGSLADFVVELTGCGISEVS